MAFQNKQIGQIRIKSYFIPASKPIPPKLKHSKSQGVFKPQPEQAFVRERDLKEESSDTEDLPLSFSEPVNELQKKLSQVHIEESEYGPAVDEFKNLLRTLITTKVKDKKAKSDINGYDLLKQYKDTYRVKERLMMIRTLKNDHLAT